MASKNRKRKSKFVWTKELIFLLVAIVVMVAAAVVVNLPTSAEKQLEKYNTAITNYNSQNSTSYSTLPTDNVFREISHDALANEKNKDDYTYVFYGVTNNAVFLENLSAINSAATNYEIKTVYIYLATWYDEATDKDTISFREELTKKEAAFKDKNEDQDEFDMSVYPTLLVFKAGKLVFNTQTYQNASTASDYSWSMYINKAMTLGK